MSDKGLLCYFGGEAAGEVPAGRGPTSSRFSSPGLDVTGEEGICLEQEWDVQGDPYKPHCCVEAGGCLRDVAQGGGAWVLLTGNLWLSVEASAVFAYPTFPNSSWDDTEIPSCKRRSSLVPQTALVDYPPPQSCLRTCLLRPRD